MTKDIAIDDEMPFLLIEGRGFRIGVDLSYYGITSVALSDDNGDTRLKGV
jgi:hypothetical protein